MSTRAMFTRVSIASMLFAVSCATASAQTGVGQYSAPRQDGTEIITYTYEDANGTTQTGSAQVDLEPVDPKKVSLKDQAAAKAKAIAAAIDAQGHLDATSLDDSNVVILTGKGKNTLKKFKVTNNTREKRNKKEVLPPAPTMAEVSFSGSMNGYTANGEPAEVEVGTNDASVLVQTTAFSTIESMVAAIVAGLQSAGVDAQHSGPGTLTIQLAPEDALSYGCDDSELVQDASLEWLGGSGDDAVDAE